MEPVIVMVSRANEAEIFDLEMMPDLPAVDLADAIASALRWNGTYDIEVGNPARRLAPQQSLADAGAWDGSRLRLVPSTRPPRRQVAPQPQQAQRPAADEPATGPVTNWRSIQQPAAGSQPAAGGQPGSPPGQPEPTPPPSSPLVGWRQPGDPGGKRRS